MNPIRNDSPPKLHTEAANIADAAQAAASPQPSEHADLLTLARLSAHTFEALNVKAAQGSELERKIAGHARRAIESNYLCLSSKQHSTRTAEYSAESNGAILVAYAHLNERSEYEIYQVSLKQDAEEPISMELPAPARKPLAGKNEPHPENSLLGMPAELRRAIMGHVLSGTDKRQGVYDMSALKNSAYILKATLAEDQLLNFNYEVRKKIITAVDKLPLDALIKASSTDLFALASQEKKEACLVRVTDSFDAYKIYSMGRALEALNPEQRSRFVRFVLDFDTSTDDADDVDMARDFAIEKGNMISGLGAGLHSIAGHHSEIVKTILDMTDDSKGYAISGVAENFHAFDLTLREELVQAVLNIEDEQSKGKAIHGLGERLSALTDQQRNAVFEAALQFESESIFSQLVVPGLGAGVQALSQDQQRRLADAVSMMVNDTEQSRALSNLGEVLKNIEGSHYVDMFELLSNSALSMSTEEDKAEGLSGLGRGLHSGGGLEKYYSEKHEQQTIKLFDTVMSMKSDNHKSNSIAGLGSGMSALNAEQRDSLIHAVLGMPSEVDRANAIGGLGLGLQAVSFGQRESLVNACLSMADDMFKCWAIAGLAKGLHVLSAEQQVSLVDAALSLSAPHRAVVIDKLGGVKDRQQFQRLLDAALDLPATASPAQASLQAGALARFIEARPV